MSTNKYEQCIKWIGAEIYHTIYSDTKINIMVGKRSNEITEFAKRMLLVYVKQSINSVKNFELLLNKTGIGSNYTSQEINSYLSIVNNEIKKGSAIIIETDNEKLIIVDDYHIYPTYHNNVVPKAGFMDAASIELYTQ